MKTLKISVVKLPNHKGEFDPSRHSFAVHAHDANGHTHCIESYEHTDHGLKAFGTWSPKNKNIAALREHAEKVSNKKLEKARRIDKIPGGLADKKQRKDFDPSQLKEGIKVELEHTSDRAIAEEIAMDHLTEDPDYYKKLKTIEKAKKAPVFTIRKRKDGQYKKMRDGEWKKLPKEKDPIADWSERLRDTRTMSQNDRDAWVAEQFRKAKKPIGHILYACRQMLRNVGLERQTGFKGFCQAIIEKCYEHGPAGVEKDSIEIWDKAFKSLLEGRPEKNVPLAKAESMAHSKAFFRDNLKWYRYCIGRLARKNEGMVNMLAVESYMKNAMKKHKTPPAIDYDE